MYLDWRESYYHIYYYIAYKNVYKGNLKKVLSTYHFMNILSHSVDKVKIIRISLTYPNH